MRSSSSNRTRFTRLIALAGLALPALACGKDGEGGNDDPATGGSVGTTGGSSGSGGAATTGGAPSGGAGEAGGASTGGAASGGTATGRAGEGGATAEGGTPTGGAASGGAGEGGAIAEGGASTGGAGGAPPTGGASSGGSTAGAAGAGAGGEAGAAPLEQVDSVTDHGVTWTFDAPHAVGRFVTGDYWVVCPVTIESVTPAPGGGRNGSVLNLPPVQDETGFDDRTVENRYEPSLAVSFPLAMEPGDSLVSSISVEEPGLVENWLREGSGEYSDSPVATVSVLTCVAEPAPADAFRPPYTGGAASLRRLSELDRGRLPRLLPPSPVDDDTLETFAERLGRPWVDNLFYAFDAQVDTMAMYGRETGRVAGIASLLVMLDLPPEQQAAQERLLVGFVQYGIDLWGLVEAGYPGWYAHGGHGSGRKWPIVFAGMVFGDPAMSSPTLSYPEVRFGEDMHTAFASDLPYGPAHNGATVVYTGHMGVWQGEPVSDDAAWGPYEHLPPDQWLDPIGENYRRCCTSLAWAGQALAARLMEAEPSWAHDAFFAYVDRWMDPSGDDAYTQEIYDLTGLDYRADWQRQGQAWDPFVEEMWAAYR